MYFTDVEGSKTESRLLNYQNIHQGGGSNKLDHTFVSIFSFLVNSLIKMFNSIKYFKFSIKQKTKDAIKNLIDLLAQKKKKLHSTYKPVGMIQNKEPFQNS